MTLRDKEFNVLVLFPQIATILAICFGLNGMKYALDGNFSYSVICILLAGVFDGLDGRIARMLKVESSFGEIFDSLADFLSFGVAPAFIMYNWIQYNGYSVKFAWIICIFYIVCCALRLARFNSRIIDNSSSPVTSFFEGVPSTIGGLLVLLPIISNNIGIFLNYEITIFWYGFIAILMVSSIPTISIKKIKLNKILFIPILILITFATIMLTTQLWLSLFLFILFYTATIPFTLIYVWIKN